MYHSIFQANHLTVAITRHITGILPNELLHCELVTSFERALLQFRTHVTDDTLAPTIKDNIESLAFAGGWGTPRVVCRGVGVNSPLLQRHAHKGNICRCCYASLIWKEAWRWIRSCFAIVVDASSMGVLVYYTLLR